MAVKQRHSRAYHQYFEDYAEKEVISSDGRRRIERVYVGSYFRLDTSDTKWILGKIAYVLLYGAAVFCLIFAGMQSLGLNYYTESRYSLIPQMISFVVLFIFLIPLFYHTFSKREMKISTFRESSEKLKRTALVAAVMLSVTAVFAAVWVAFQKQPFDWTAAKCIFGNMISACAMWCILLLEHRAVYEQLPPKEQRPESSTVLRY